MKKIKNLKIFNKKMILILTAVTLGSTLTGCVKTNKDILKEQEIALDELKQEKKDLESKNKQLKEQVNNLTATATPTVTLVTETPSPDIINDWAREDKSLTVSQDTAKKLFYSFDKLDVDSIGSTYYDQYLGQNVCKLVENGAEYIVNAEDPTIVYLGRHDSISNPTLNPYLKQSNGGPDVDGYVCEIIKNGGKYLVDASDYTRVYRSGYDSISEAYLNDTYNDYVCDISEKKRVYTVDASNYTKVYNIKK